MHDRWIQDDEDESLRRDIRRNSRSDITIKWGFSCGHWLCISH